MKIKILETGEVKELSLIEQGLDLASDLINNYKTSKDYDPMARAWIMPKALFEFWQDIFSKAKTYKDAYNLLQSKDAPTL